MSFIIWGRTPTQEMQMWALKGLLAALSNYESGELLFLLTGEDYNPELTKIASFFGDEIQFVDYNYHYVEYVLTALIGKE